MAATTGPRGYARSTPVLPGLTGAAIGYGGLRFSGVPEATPSTAGLHRGLPSGTLTFIITMDAPIVCGASAAAALAPDADRRRVLMSGLHTAPAYVVQPSGQAGIQVAVSPVAARALFGVPAAALTDAGLASEGADVWGRSADHLRDRLTEQVLATGSWSAAFSLLRDELRRRVERAGAGARPRPELVEAWRRLSWQAAATARGAAGRGTMAGLADHVALSPRQLSTLFRREYGVSPKTLARLLRFQHVTADLATASATGRAPSLAEVAHRFGYYDQSHLDRDFRTFAHATPTGWLRAERANIDAGGHRLGMEAAEKS